MKISDTVSLSETLIFGKFSLFPRARSLEIEGVRVAIGSRAIEILSLLLEQAGTVVGKKELIARAWPHANVDESGLKVQVASLRRILGDRQHGARYIATVSGRGYSFVAPVERKGPAEAASQWLTNFAAERGAPTLGHDDITIRLADHGPPLSMIAGG